MMNDTPQLWIFILPTINEEFLVRVFSHLLLVYSWQQIPGHPAPTHVAKPGLTKKPHHTSWPFHQHAPAINTFKGSLLQEGSHVASSTSVACFKQFIILNFGHKNTTCLVSDSLATVAGNRIAWNSGSDLQTYKSNWGGDKFVFVDYFRRVSN